MKKIFLLLVIIIFVFITIGCSNKSKSNLIDKAADNMKIYYGTKNIAPNHIIEKDKVKEFTDCFNNLTFEKSEIEIETSTMLIIVFYNDKEQVVTVNVDKEGVFQINDDNEYLQVASGSFNYNDFFYYVLMV